MKNLLLSSRLKNHQTRGSRVRAAELRAKEAEAKIDAAERERDVFGNEVTDLRRQLFEADRLLRARVRLTEERDAATEKYASLIQYLLSSSPHSPETDPWAKRALHAEADLAA